MKTLLSKIILVSLTLTLSVMQSARADGVVESPHNYLPSGYVTPADNTCFDGSEMKDLANFKKGCDVCKMDLADTKATLNKCVAYGAPATKWWASPSTVVGGMVISLSLGVLIGAFVK